MKILAIVIAGTVLLGGVIAGVFMKWQGSDDDGAATPVRVETVARGNLIEVVAAPGQVQPKTKVSISARVAARIVELPYEEGETVTAGNPKANPPVPPSVLVKLDATEMEAQLRASEARAAGQKAQLQEATARVGAQESQIAAAKVMLLDAQRDLRRHEQLLESSDVSQAEVDEIRARAEQLEKQMEASTRELEAGRLNLVVLKHAIEAAEADIARARDNLNYTTIVSPIDGIITRLNAKVGEMVVTGTMNNPGTVILEVSDLSEMQVDAQVDETNIAMVREGQKATVRIAAYPEEEFSGVVKLVGLDTAQDQRSQSSFGSSPQPKWYRARIVLDTNGQRIPAGLSADVDIETRTHENIIKVPTQAVMGRPYDEIPEKVRNSPDIDPNKTLITVVYRYEDGKAALTPVTISAGDMTHTAITSGLKDGDRIITGPYKVLPDLKDGQNVKEDNPTTQPTTQPAAA